MEKLHTLVTVCLGFSVIVAVLSLISVLLIRSNVTISPDLLGAIVGYLFADIKIILAYYFYRKEQFPPEG